MTGEAQQPQAAETDILAEAANAQFRAADFMGAGVVRGVAPAKVNLFLGVGDVRDDGRHEVTNVMHALALHDVLHVNALPLDTADADAARAAMEAGSERFAFGGPAENLLVSVEMVDKTVGIADAYSAGPEALSARDNLAFRAADLLAHELGRTEPERVLIRIEKQIPAQAGLGGGSSDAACVLRCLGAQWAADDAVVQQVACRIGADVPFFLQGGCALYDGAGERFVRELTPLRTPLVLVKPFAGVSTAEAYQAFDAAPCMPTQQQLAQVLQAEAAAEVPLFNGLANAAAQVQPEVAAVREWMSAQAEVDARRMLMSGSGSAFFAEMDSFAQASKVAAAAKQAGFWARPTSFARLRAQTA